MNKGLHSIPVKLGVEGSFKLVRGFHIGMVVLLLLAFAGSGLGWIYLLGVCRGRGHVVL